MSEATDAHNIIHEAVQKVIQQYEVKISFLERNQNDLITIMKKAYEACSTGDKDAMLECITLCDQFNMPF